MRENWPHVRRGHYFRHFSHLASRGIRTREVCETGFESLADRRSPPSCKSSVYKVVQLVPTRGENQRIVDSNVVPLRNDPKRVRDVSIVIGTGSGRRTEFPGALAYVVQDITNLAAGDIGKLVRTCTLTTPTLRQHCSARRSARILRTQTVNQNVSIEERPNRS